jgi:hypothetical protein
MTGRGSSCEVENPMRLRRLVGATFIAFPLAINVPFALLTMRFGYPDILRRPAA